VRHIKHNWGGGEPRDAADPSLMLPHLQGSTPSAPSTGTTVSGPVLSFCPSSAPSTGTLAPCFQRLLFLVSGEYEG
jgi:hypothetical protein